MSAAPISAAAASASAPAPDDDARWLQDVYQGHDAPQLTARAVFTGALIGGLMSIGNLYTVLKVGLGFGVAITSCVLSFVVWNALRAAAGGRLGQMTILENNCMQTTASAAGYSTVLGMAATFAALMLLDPEHRQQPWWVVAAFTFTTAMLGVLLTIPIKRVLVNQERLPFPSGTAAAATLRGLYGGSRDAVLAARVLLAGIAAGAISGVLSTAETQFAALGRFFEWMRADLFEVHLPDQLPAQGFGLIAGKPVIGYGFEPSLTMMGFGLIVGPRVAFSMLLASAALYMGFAPWLQGLDAAHAGEAGYVPSLALVGGALYHPLRWSLWGGASVLVFASFTALALQWRLVARAFAMLRSSAGRDVAAGDAMAEVEVPGTWMVVGLVPIGLALLALQVFAFHVSWWAGVLAIVATFGIGFVVARSTGETDMSPAGALGKLMQLMFAFIAPPAAVGAQASVAQNVLSAGASVSSASAAAELLSDLKTGYLLGANPRKQFLAQIAGVAFGTLVCVPAWFLLIPDMKALEAFPAPSAQLWVAMARALTGGLATLPPSVGVAVVAGAFVGIALPLMEKLAPRLRAILPSATGIGMGWIVPFSIPLSFAIGAAFGIAWKRLDAAARERYAVPLASGLIAGESMLKAALAMLASAIALGS